VTLPKPMFSVKVSSTPPGATITVAGKNVGITPTTVRLVAFEVSTLTLTRDGYATELQRITPKTNNQTVHANLKKTPRKAR
jgi:PEGA domain